MMSPACTVAGVSCGGAQAAVTMVAAANAARALNASFIVFVLVCGRRSGADSRTRLERAERDELVHGSNTDERVDRAAEHGHLPEDGADEVEACGSDKTPVDASDYEQGNGEQVQSFHVQIPPKWCQNRLSMFCPCMLRGWSPHVKDLSIYFP